MPNRLIVWVSGREEGNPTRSIEVNKLIKRVKKKEVRKQGRPSKAKRPLTVEEEWKIMKIICVNNNRDNWLWRCGLYALTNFQCSLVLTTPLRFCWTTSKSTTTSAIS